MKDHKEHYLKRELYELMGREPVLFDFLQNGSLDGLWYWDIENPEQEWMNSAFWELLGYDPKEKKHLASEWQGLINPDDLKLAISNYEKHCADPSHPYDQIVRYRHKDGSTVWGRCRGIAIRDKTGKAIRMLGAHNDYTQIKRIEETLRKKNRELESLARHDHLTSLYNRMAFDEHFEKQLLISIREKMPISIALIDIDFFKKINDSFGHQKGDEVLCRVADILQHLTRDSDTLARFGGEEFIVILFAITTPESLDIGERFRIGVDGHVKDFKDLTVSIGLSTFFDKEITTKDVDIKSLSEQIIFQADQALYSAKNSGRNKVCHYHD